MTYQKKENFKILCIALSHFYFKIVYDYIHFTQCFKGCIINYQSSHSLEEEFSMILWNNVLKVELDSRTIYIVNSIKIIFFMLDRSQFCHLQVFQLWTSYFLSLITPISWKVVRFRGDDICESFAAIFYGKGQLILAAIVI